MQKVDLIHLGSKKKVGTNHSCVVCESRVTPESLLSENT